VNYYLLVYDRRRGEIMEREDFRATDRGRAFKRRLEKMIERREQPDVEVVLFSAESFSDLLKTHSRYFKTPEEILAGIDPVRG